MASMYRLFMERDLTLIEINPLVVSGAVAWWRWTRR